jgi:hypothetical protein
MRLIRNGRALRKSSGEYAMRAAMVHGRADAEDAQEGRAAGEELRELRRPFAWRKKWAKVWDEVKYCSERCRAAKPPNETGDGI